MITFKSIGNIRTTNIIIWSVSIVLFLCSSCSGGDKLNFKSHEDALTAYQDYLNTVKNIKSANTNSFCKEIKDWKNISDTVYHYLMKDSTFVRNIHCAGAYASIHDSIRYEMLRLTETWRYSYEDVLRIKEQTSVFHDDQELHMAVSEAQPFFSALDSIHILEETKAGILFKYREFLKESKKKGIHDKASMLDYICKEDVLFRSFLAHLYEMEDEPLSDITQETESICRNIFIAARDGEISARDAMVFMSMRTVRRLLQNSTACIRDINNQQMKSKAQGNAYLWMIIQPFISIDQFSIATLTPQEQSNFTYIISQLPKSVRFAKTFDIDQRALNYLLPQQLLKMYVLTL
jgi:hypothetical protein